MAEDVAKLKGELARKESELKDAHLDQKMLRELGQEVQFARSDLREKELQLGKAQA